MELKNEVRLSGRVGTDPKQFGRGPFKFRIGHGGGGKHKDGSPWPTQWFSVAVWDTKLLDGLAKGVSIELTGKLRHASYVAKDGQQKSAVEIVAEAITVHEAQKQPAPITPNIHGQRITDEDIPF